METTSHDDTYKKQQEQLKELSDNGASSSLSDADEYAATATTGGVATLKQIYHRFSLILEGIAVLLAGASYISDGERLKQKKASLGFDYEETEAVDRLTQIHSVPLTAWAKANDLWQQLLQSQEPSDAGFDIDTSHELQNSMQEMLRRILQGSMHLCWSQSLYLPRITTSESTFATINAMPLVIDLAAKSAQNISIGLMGARRKLMRELSSLPEILANSIVTLHLIKPPQMDILALAENDAKRLAEGWRPDTPLPFTVAGRLTCSTDKSVRSISNGGLKTQPELDSDGNMMAHFRRLSVILEWSRKRPEGEFRHKTTQYHLLVQWIITTKTGKINLSTLSAPFFIATKQSQLAELYGRMVLNKLASPPESISCQPIVEQMSWIELSLALRHIFYRLTLVRRLTDGELMSIKQRLLGSLTSEMVSMTQLFEEELKSPKGNSVNCTFWKWFFEAAVIVSKQINMEKGTNVSQTNIENASLPELFEKGIVLGFISRADVETILLSIQQPALVIRFSDNHVGHLTVSYRCEGQQTVTHIRPVNRDIINGLSLPAIIAWMHGPETVQHIVCGYECRTDARGATHYADVRLMPKAELLRQQRARPDSGCFDVDGQRDTSLVLNLHSDGSASVRSEDSGMGESVQSGSSDAALSAAAATALTQLRLTSGRPPPTSIGNPAQAHYYNNGLGQMPTPSLPNVLQPLFLQSSQAALLQHQQRMAALAAISSRGFPFLGPRLPTTLAGVQQPQRPVIPPMHTDQVCACDSCRRRRAPESMFDGAATATPPRTISNLTGVTPTNDSSSSSTITSSGTRKIQIGKQKRFRRTVVQSNGNKTAMEGSDHETTT